MKKSAALIFVFLIIMSGCFFGWQGSSAPGEPGGGETLLVFGKLGSHQGYFNKPRAGVWFPDESIFVADMTGRIQRFNSSGEYLLAWKTPDITKGRPRALAAAPDGTLLVLDCHYYKVRRYTLEGKLLSSWGVHGTAPGEFALTTDVTVDNAGNVYITQYQEDADCVQVFTPEGRFIRRFGAKGSGPGMFERPMGVTVDSAGFVYVADCCNNRVQKFTSGGKFVKQWGGRGREPGRMFYPYDIVCDPWDRLVVAEYGNNRVSKYNAEGRLLALWGAAGTAEGRCHGPWGVAATAERDVYFVIDSGNNRVQKIRVPDGAGGVK